MLNVGDNVYYLHKEFGILTRKKIYMTDDNGVEWFRYDKPAHTFTIKTTKIIGIVQYSVKGTQVSWEDNLVDGQTTYHTDLDYTFSELGEEFYGSREEAERAGEAWKQSFNS